MVYFEILCAVLVDLIAVAFDCERETNIRDDNQKNN